MSDQPTVEAIWDKSEYGERQRLVSDRPLASGTYHLLPADEYIQVGDHWLKVRDCEACGGTSRSESYLGQGPIEDVGPCPDCTDGKVIDAREFNDAYWIPKETP